MIWILAIPCQYVSFRKKYSYIHYPLPPLDFSSFKLCKRSIKDRCNKIIGHYENIDCAEFADLFINSLTT
jgi:hypothetical protein